MKVLGHGQQQIHQCHREQDVRVQVDALHQRGSVVGEGGVSHSATERSDTLASALAFGLEPEHISQEEPSVHAAGERLARDDPVVEEPGQVLARDAQHLGGLVRGEHLVGAEHGDVVPGRELLTRSTQQAREIVREIDPGASGVDGDEGAFESGQPASRLAPVG